MSHTILSYRIPHRRFELSPFIIKIKARLNGTTELSTQSNQFFKKGNSS